MNSSDPVSFVARVVGLLVMMAVSAVCLGILGVGLVLCGLFGRFAVELANTYRWARVPCEIVSSVVREGPSPGRAGRPPALEVQFRYGFQGRTYMTNQQAGGSDYSELERFKQRYAPGRWSACYVNPRPPHQVILERESLWVGLFLGAAALFALGLATVSGCGAYAFIRASVFLLTTPGLPPTAPRQPRRIGAVAGRWFGRVVFGGLLLGSALFLYALTVGPMVRMLGARGWVTTPCTVISSGVEAKDTAKGRTYYGANIVYSYEVAGHRYLANRYSFAEVASDRTASHDAIARRYPSGTTNVCYVHPRDPTRVVLERGFTSDLWWGMLPLAGLLLAAFGWMVTSGRKTSEPGAPAAPGR